MGYIDKTTYTLSCPKCSAQESAGVLDKGSGWNGSCWDSTAAFSEFKMEWSGGGAQMPRPISPTCNKCGTKAHVEFK